MRYSCRCLGGQRVQSEVVQWIYAGFESLPPRALFAFQARACWDSVVLHRFAEAFVVTAMREHLAEQACENWDRDQKDTFDLVLV